jgi:hypothetical protein
METPTDQMQAELVVFLPLRRDSYYPGQSLRMIPSHPEVVLDALRKPLTNQTSPKWHNPNMICHSKTLRPAWRVVFDTMIAEWLTNRLT